MNCHEVKELSSAYLDQKLAPSQISSFEEHLNGCASCREEVEGLRKTISLIGSLDEIETSPNFLGKLHGKLDRKGIGGRIWDWFFEPFIIKVPLQVTALLLVSITAFYLYYRSPELSGEYGLPASLEGVQVTQDKLQGRALERKSQIQKGGRTVESEIKVLAEIKKEPMTDKVSESATIGRDEVVMAKREKGIPTMSESSQEAQVKPQEEFAKRHGRELEDNRIAKAEPTVEERTQLFMRKLSTDVEKKERKNIVATAPKREIQEFRVNKVALYERRVKVLLEKVGGSLLSQEGSSESGLLLTVELPQSRQDEFFEELKKEIAAASNTANLRQGRAMEVSRYVGEKDDLKAVETPQTKLTPALQSPLRVDEPVVTLRLRILPIK